MLMVDANPSYVECFRGSHIRPFSIKWLRIQHGMDDPFIQQLLGWCPNSTTQTPNRDVEFIYMYGINATSIST